MCRILLILPTELLQNSVDSVHSDAFKTRFDSLGLISCREIIQILTLLLALES